GGAFGDAFVLGHDPGLHAVLLAAPPLAAGAAEAGLHLVADEHAAILAHDPDGDLEVLLGRRDEPAHALDGLGEEARDLAGRGRADQLVDVLGALHLAARIGESARTAVAVGRERVLDAGDLGRHRAPRRLRAERLRQHRAPRVAVPQRDDLAAPGVDLRHHDAGLVGLRAARGEVALLELARRDRGELLRQLD